MFMQHFDKWKTNILLKHVVLDLRPPTLKILVLLKELVLKLIFCGITLSKAKKAICFSDPAKAEDTIVMERKMKGPVAGYYYHYNKKEDKAGWVHQIGWDCRKGLAPVLPRITNIKLLKTGKQTCLHALLLLQLFLNIVFGCYVLIFQ